MNKITRYFKNLISARKPDRYLPIKGVNLSLFEKRLGFVFRNKGYLHCALTHTSYINEKNITNLESNQRMELLGDAVLDLIITEELMLLFKSEDEGALSKMRAFLVNEDSLFELALEIDLGRYLFLGKGEENSRGREKPSILSDAYEAVVAAMYLDGGYSKVKDVILRHYRNKFQNLVLKKEDAMADFDYKTRLQEYVQNILKKTPEYFIVENRGPEHNKEFKSVVKIDGKIFGTGHGKSKKIAEQNSAFDALKGMSYFKDEK